MSYEIIDFHTHPFLTNETNICNYIENCNMSPDNTVRDLKNLGYQKICGSVVKSGKTWEDIRACNDEALTLWKKYGVFYVPGFHVHPDYIKESCAEIERMAEQGIHLIGELVPYMNGWCDYSCRGFSEILDFAARYGMIVSFHSMNDDQMDEMVKKHPDVTFVAAHPGEYEAYMRHLARMKMSENYYLDLSGTGLFRHGMLRYGIDVCGVGRFLYGSDFPTCNPAMFLGGIVFDDLLSEEEKQAVLSKNAKGLLKLY